MTIKEKRTKWFSILLALFPLLSNYVSPISGIDMGSFILIIFSVFAISSTWYKNDFLPLYLYVLLFTPIMLLLSPAHDTTTITIVMRCAKFIVVLGCVFGFGLSQKYYNEKIAFNTVKKLIYACAVLIILQRALYLSGIVLENPLIRFATNDAYIDGYTMRSNLLFRPSAFFLEPSHLAVYGLVLLTYLLFKEDNLKQSVIVSIVILCSGSGIGLVFCVIVYCFYFLMRFQKHFVRTILAMCAGIIATIGMSRMTFFKQVVYRLTTDNLAGGGNAIQARIGSGYQLFLEKDWWQQLFGSGYGNVPAGVYLNGMTYILNTLGIIGACVFLVLILKYIYKGKRWQKIGVLIVLGLTIGSQVFTPGSLAFYFCVYQNFPSSDNRKITGS